MNNAICIKTGVMSCTDIGALLRGAGKQSGTSMRVCTHVHTLGSGPATIQEREGGVVCASPVSSLARRLINIGRLKSSDMS